jgi:Zn-finger nucleic acid-binding protein
MKCPKCSSDMETVAVDTVQIDRCKKCKGLWFDEFELAELKTVKGAESLDIGDVATGKKLNKQDNFHCPKCNAPMIRMVDKDQSHIWYETCAGCGGSFLDAGEFKDMKKNNIVDRFKDILMELKGGRKVKAARLPADAVRRILG